MGDIVLNGTYYVVHIRTIGEIFMSSNKKPHELGERMDIQEQPCLGVTFGCIESIHNALDSHQRLVDYLIYEVSELSEETIDNRHIYAYMLELSNSRIEDICTELDEFIMKERKRIFRVES